MKKVFRILHFSLVLLSYSASAQETAVHDWTRRMGSGAGSDVGYAIKTDATGNVYTTGTFEGTVDFNPGAGVFNLTSAGGVDIFISKLDASGNFLWAKQLGGASSEFAWSLQLDAMGNIYTAGYFFGTADFDPGTGNADLTVVGSSDGFISKLDNDGNFVWVKQVGGASSDRIEAMELRGSAIAFVGTFFGTADFDPGPATFPLTSAGSEEVFVVSIDLDGNFNWAGKLGGVGSDQGRAISIDPTGNIYAAGIFNGTSDFDPGSGTTNLTASGSFDTFITKLTPTGNFVWVRRLGGTGATTPQIAYSEAPGFVHLSGTFDLTTDFDPGLPNVDLTSNGALDVYLVKLDENGNYVWSKTWGGTGSDIGYGIVTDLSGKIYIAGGFNNTVDFDPGAGVANLTSAGITDIYISKLDESGSYLWAGRMGGTSVDLARAIALDASGNLFTTGFFRSTSDFDPGPGTFNLTSFSGTEDVFVHKLKPNPTAPTITSFSPTSGEVGTIITVTGTNFGATPADNIVYFGATRASVAAATTTQLTVTVPTGATYKPLTVLNVSTSLLAYSTTNFTPTFVPNKGSITTSDFDPKIDFTTGSNPLSVAIGDLDGDGKADLAVANTASNTISIFRNIGTGAGNISYATKVDYPAAADPQTVSIGDLDGDGKADLAVANYIGFSVSVFRNTSTGVGNISYAAKVDFATGLTHRSVAIGDLDGDGKADLVLANDNGSSVSVLRNTSTGPGNISYAPKIDFASGASPYFVAIGDLDGDGKSDLAVANFGSSSVSIFRNTSTGVGNISYATNIDYTTGANPSSVTIGDLDGDGKADLAVVNKNSTSVSVFRNISTGVGTISYAAKIDYVTATDPRSVSIGDLDGDGKADLAVTNYASNSASVFRNTSTGAGNINYASKVDFTTGTNPLFISTGDSDGDGKTDLVVVNASSNSVSIIRNNPMFSGSPTITSFTPTIGPIGTTVTITGTNFSTTPANNIVMFNGVAATVTASTPTSIEVTVPAGATTGKITVTVGGSTATSTSDFTVTTTTNQPPIIAANTSAAPINGIITIDLLPLLSDPDDNIDLSTLSLTSNTSAQGAIASITAAFELVLDYADLSFAGTDHVDLSVCDVLGECAEQTLTIEVRSDVVIYNAISPNEDGLNDTFQIEYIDILPETRQNTVTIFNRWGTKVFETSDYNNHDNVFKGLNMNGNELPSGTYYYKIEYRGGKSSKTGYLALKR